MPKVALVYDWADTGYGGAEKVLLALKKIYPQADLYTAFANFDQAVWLKNFQVIRTSFLQNLPHFLQKRKALLAPLMPLAFALFDLRQYDLIISVCSFAAKGVHTNRTQKHYCYLLTPTRFLYSHTQDYLPPKFAWLCQPFLSYLRHFDQRAIKNPDKVIVLSKLVAQRCWQFYHRYPDAIIYPLLPTTTSRSSILSKNRGREQEPHFLIVSRLVAYKCLDLAVVLCARLNLSLTIVGTGPELSRLKRLARWSPKITFLGNVDQKTLNNCYNKATALFAPGEEDFGLNLIEANRAGLWLLANRQSGAMELFDQTSAFPIEKQTLTATAAALAQFLSMWQHHWRPPVKIAATKKHDFVANWKKLIKD